MFQNKYTNAAIVCSKQCQYTKLTIINYIKFFKKIIENHSDKMLERRGGVK